MEVLVCIGVMLRFLTAFERLAVRANEIEPRQGMQAVEGGEDVVVLVLRCLNR